MVSNDDVKYVELEAAKRAMAQFIGYGQIDEDMVKRFEIALEHLQQGSLKKVGSCGDCRYSICENGKLICTNDGPYKPLFEYSGRVVNKDHYCGYWACCTAGC